VGYPLQLALRYLGSKKRAFVSVGTAFAILGVTLGVAALAIVMSVTGGFQQQFKEKVLGVNAHVLVLKYSIDFREYRDVMKKVRNVPGVTGVAPFIINPMMITHGDRTATGVLLKGVDPGVMGEVLDLPKHIKEPKELLLPDGSIDREKANQYLQTLRKPGAKPPERPHDPFRDPLDDWDAGAKRATDDDAGGGEHSLLDEIRREIEADDARQAAATVDAGAEAKPLSPAAPPAAAHAKPAGPMPTGDMTPDGGYASVLPDDDVLPDAIDPDPCKSAEQVAKLPGVVMGRTLSQQLGVGIGDCVQITSPTIGIAFGASGARPPIAKQFRVIAIFEAGFDQYDSKLVYTDLYEAQQFYEQGDSVTGVEMKVDDVDRAHAIAKDIDKLLNNGVYRTMDWHELNRGLFTALLIQQIGMSAVLALIIVVAAFTVIATLIMVVLEKKKEIALLKALGAKDDAVLRVFFYQGGIIGLIGTSLGLVVGFIGCKAISAYRFPLDPKVYFISYLPTDIRPFEFGITGLIAIGVCLLATIFPSLYAARLRPSDGLRAE
jgi:lipoprotein-releasing system permease protein